MYVIEYKHKYGSPHGNIKVSTAIEENMYKRLLHVLSGRNHELISIKADGVDITDELLTVIADSAGLL